MRASTLILFGLRKWSPQKLVGLAILVLLISPPLRTATGYAWTDLLSRLDDVRGWGAGRDIVGTMGVESYFGQW